MTWLLDCDGVVWLSEQVIEGAPEAVASLRESGSRVVLLTNNSYPRRSDHLAKLERMGMATDPADVLTSAMAAALLLEAGERALVLGGPGILEELNERGVATVTPGAGREIGPVDAVVVGPRPDLRLLVSHRGRLGAARGCTPHRHQRRSLVPHAAKACSPVPVRCWPRWPVRAG